MEPWSKKHKKVTKSKQGGLKYSLSNSFAQPLSQRELIDLSLANGNQVLVNDYYNHTLNYTSNGGSYDLRLQISKLYSTKINPENILVFTGAQVALQTAAAVLAKDCHSIVFTPGYQSTVMGPSMFGTNNNVTQIKLSASNNWQIQISKVKEAIIPGKTKYMVINEPYNPAGTLMSLTTQTQLIQLCQTYNIKIMSDEVYRLLEHDVKDRLPAMADVYDSGISCVTLSKPWGGCGVTIGWLAFQDLSIKQELVDVQYFGTACPGRATELQAIMTLRSSDIILKKNLTIIRSNLKLLRQFMHRYQDLFSWVEPKAGAVCFIKFLGTWTSEEFGERLANEMDVSIKPAYCFSDAVEDDIDYFRVGYGESKMELALKELIKFVEMYKLQWRNEMISSKL